MLSICNALPDDVLLLSALIPESAEVERNQAVLKEDHLLRDGLSPQPKIRALIAKWTGQSSKLAILVLRHRLRDSRYVGSREEYV